MTLCHKLLTQEGTATIFRNPKKQRCREGLEDSCMLVYYTSIKIIKNEVGCRDDTVPKTADTRRHCEEE